MAKYFEDQPKSEGIANALKRAEQMLSFSWTPIKPYPTGHYLRNVRGESMRVDDYMPAWKPQTGLPYSSVRIHEQYIGINASFETFVTALRNPDSVLYKKVQHGLGKGMSSYYGVVCSAFVSYAAGFPYRTACAQMARDPDMQLLDTSSSLNGLELCDIILNPKTHVAMIIGITRDENGNVVKIRTGESVMSLRRSRSGNTGWKTGTACTVMPGSKRHRTFRARLRRSPAKTPGKRRPSIRCLWPTGGIISTSCRARRSSSPSSRQAGTMSGSKIRKAEKSLRICRSAAATSASRRIGAARTGRSACAG